MQYEGIYKCYTQNQCLIHLAIHNNTLVYKGKMENTKCPIYNREM